MPIRKFRSVGDMPPPRRAATALEGLTAACNASQFSKAFGNQRVAPRGVFKFASIEEASAFRDRWEAGEAIEPSQEPS
jgi:hypothetical protein